MKKQQLPVYMIGDLVMLLSTGEVGLVREVSENFGVFARFGDIPEDDPFYISPDKIALLCRRESESGRILRWEETGFPKHDAMTAAVYIDRRYRNEDWYVGMGIGADSETGEQCFYVYTKRKISLQIEEAQFGYPVKVKPLQGVRPL